jgi:hypothetical protein
MSNETETQEGTGADEQQSPPAPVVADKKPKPGPFGRPLKDNPRTTGADGKAIKIPRMDEPPRLGEIVFYILPAKSKNAGQRRAAIITAVFPDETVNLYIFAARSNDSESAAKVGAFIDFGVKYDAAGEKMTWHRDGDPASLTDLS